MHKKPIIFFSHSSADHDAIAPIRERLLEATENAIEIFMASDGESIRCGTNWLTELEKALGKCELMFVWMSPSAKGSYWIPFEAGFAYSKDINVIPLAFQGEAIESLPAPFDILQGFNVQGDESLNNIVTEINRIFGTTFPPAFEKGFYSRVINDNSAENNPAILKYVHQLECSLIDLNPGGVNELCTVLDDSGENYVREDNILIAGRSRDDRRIKGVGFELNYSVIDDVQASLVLDPMALYSTWHIWLKAYRASCKREWNALKFNIILNSSLTVSLSGSLVGSRLRSSEVSFDTDAPYQKYRYRNIEFSISEEIINRETSRKLILYIPKDNDAPIPIYSLLELLYERKIIEGDLS